MMIDSIGPPRINHGAIIPKCRQQGPSGAPQGAPKGQGAGHVGVES